jgi:crotonobetainyl-CoA:carnitine CoA-transferase CaiB-like acyl-CoA transferase
MCAEAQVPCGPVNSIRDIFDDPQFAARENMIKLPVDGLGEIVVANVVPRLSETPGSVDRAGPKLGEHTEAILSDLLELDSRRISELRQRGAI